MSIEPPMRAFEDKVCSTREQARAFVAQHPDVSPSLAVYLRCDQATDRPPVSGNLKALLEARAIELPDRPGVEIMTPSFAHEILKAWPKAQLVGANEDVQASFDLPHPPSQRTRK